MVMLVGDVVELEMDDTVVDVVEVTHTEDDDAPSTLEYVPSGQSLHAADDVAPALDENVPAKQLLTVDAPLTET